MSWEGFCQAPIFKEKLKHLWHQQKCFVLGGRHTPWQLFTLRTNPTLKGGKKCRVRVFWCAPNTFHLGGTGEIWS